MYAGQPIAIAVAETEALAADAIELIDVELEPARRRRRPRGRRPARLAARPAPRRRRGRRSATSATPTPRSSAGGVGDEEELSENVLGTARLADGDVDAALAASEVVVRGRFHTPWVYQGYLEPQTATAWFDVDDELVVSTSTQAPFMTRDELASAVRAAGRPRPRPRRAARRRVRRQDDDPRAAGRRGRARARAGRSGWR